MLPPHGGWVPPRWPRLLGLLNHCAAYGVAVNALPADAQAAILAHRGAVLGVASRGDGWMVVRRLRDGRIRHEEWQTATDGSLQCSSAGSTFTRADYARAQETRALVSAFRAGRVRFVEGPESERAP